MGYAPRRRTGRKISVSGEVDFDQVIDIAELEDSELLDCVAEARDRGLIISGVKAQVLRDIQADLILRRDQKAIVAFTDARGEDPLQEIAEALEARQINKAIALLDKVIDPPPSRTATVIPLDCRRPPPPDPPADHDFDAILDPDSELWSP